MSQPPDGSWGLLLARHGQTDDNLEPIHAQGFRDTPLNAAGRAQARELAERVRSLADSPRGSAGDEPAGWPDWGPVRSLWCSDLRRAAETAAIVGARIGLVPRPEPRLREGSRGEWEGRRFIDIRREDPDGYAAWMRGGAAFRFPGGESLQEHADRVMAALRDIRDAGPLPALVVCHRGSIRAVLCQSDPRGLDAFHDYDVPNTGVVPL